MRTVIALVVVLALCGLAAFLVLAGDDAGSLATRVLAVEHRLLPAVVEAYAEGRFVLSTAGRVAWNGSWYPDDEFTMVSSKTTD